MGSGKLVMTQRKKELQFLFEIGVNEEFAHHEFRHGYNT